MTFCILISRLGPRVALLSLKPDCAIKQSQITPTQNLLHTKQPLNILNGVKPWMLNIKPYRSSVLGLWFQLLLMQIWFGVSGFSSLSYTVMAPLLVTNLDLWPKDSNNRQVSTILRPSVQSLSQPLSDLFLLLQSVVIGL